MKRLLGWMLFVLFLCGLALPASAAAVTPAKTERAVVPRSDASLPDGVEELYRLIPTGAWRGQKTTLKEAGGDPLTTCDPDHVAIYTIMEVYGIQRPEDPTAELPLDLEELRASGAPRVPAAEVKAIYEQLYGPGSFDFRRRGESTVIAVTGATDDMFLYDASDDCYVYTHCSTGGGERSWVLPYAVFLRQERQGDELYLYDKYGLYVDAYGKYGSDGLSYEIYGDSAFALDSTEKGLSNSLLLKSGVDPKNFQESATSAYSRLMAGEFDDVLPVYKHTFRKNAEGGWYWVSSEPVKQVGSNPDTADGGVGLAAALTLCGGAALCAVAVLRRRAR